MATSVQAFGRGRARTGGQILVDQLKIHGVELAFCVPGESYIAVLDALYDASDTIKLITCRQEGGAANMAEAYGKLTGRPGVCFVSRGPGATNASIGIHTAAQDSTPMVVFVGQIKRAHVGREAFQEIDYRHLFGHIAKWVFQIDDPTRIPELVSRAFQLAVSGRPGPVVLALPEDMLSEDCITSDVGPYRRVQASPSSAQMEALRRLMRQAERPFMIVGGSDWTAAAAANIVAFAEANCLPTGAAFRCQDYFDNSSTCYAGTVGLGLAPPLARRIAESDLLLVVGDRLSEAATNGYTLVDIPRPRQTFVHVHPDPAELGRVYQSDLPILSGMPEFAAAARALPAIDAPEWSRWTHEAHDDYIATLEYALSERGVDLAGVVTYLRRTLPRDSIIANGAGNYTIWCHRFYQFSVFRTQLAPTSGAMGYGVPAGIAAKAIARDRDVVIFTGDGDFLMNGQELATAVQNRLNVIVILVNNGMYGTIRMHQERNHPGRDIATRLTNPSFAGYAEAFGAYGEVVERTSDFPAAFERARAAGRPALLDLRVDPDLITPVERLSALRANPPGAPSR